MAFYQKLVTNTAPWPAVLDLSLFSQTTSHEGAALVSEEPA